MVELVEVVCSDVSVCVVYYVVRLVLVGLPVVVWVLLLFVTGLVDSTIAIRCRGDKVTWHVEGVGLLFAD